MLETGSDVRTVDSLEQDFLRLTAAVSRLDALRLEILRQLDVAQAASADGARNLTEWVAGRFDLESDTAKTLVMLARTADPHLETLLQTGRVSTDRAAAVVRLKTAGADQTTVDASWSHDLAGVRRLTAAHRRISPQDETEAFDARRLFIQPSLDDTITRIWGQVTGTDGHLIEKALQAAIDSFPNHPDTTAAQDRADALVAVASEWLTGQVGGHDLTAEIFIDGDLAAVTDGHAGASVVSGPRVGPNTLSEILCAGTIRINFSDHYGNLSVTPTSRTIPSAIRRRVFHRDGYRCVIAGCNSRTRLQPHHLVPYSQGGTHHPDNLATVCWYHHHIVIHQQGRRIDPNSPPQRRTFLRTRHPSRAGP